MIKIKQGLDLPISGAPVQSIEDGPKVRSVGVVGFDYVGMKPTMAVREGDRVKTGQLLFTDKKTEGVRYTAPATGVVSAINRGEKRALQSVVIDVEDDEYETFTATAAADLGSLSREQVQDTLVETGLWTALRTRPYSRVPALHTEPSSIFVNAMDTNPLAADPAVVLAASADNADAFKNGLTALSRLTDGKVFLCKASGADIASNAAATVEEFSGPHPAGLPGTHIHHLDPVHGHKQVWTINYQDVMAIGKTLTGGKLCVDRVVSLGGPRVENPTLLRTRLGANLEEMTAGRLSGDNNRIISGSVFGGRKTNTATAFLGRYHLQVSVLEEGTHRELFGWLSPGAKKHSVLGIYISKLLGTGKLDFTTTTNGSERAMVPVGNYERVMPLDILPTQLLRSLIVGDTAMAQSLGALELDEEDLALCTYVCPGKYEYGPILRDNLTRIEKEG